MDTPTLYIIAGCNGAGKTAQAVMAQAVIPVHLLKGEVVEC